jgi:2-polyprenyl-6-methoxyphenol hydroxylase-like FAD-dependent oxidoreductase
LIGLLAEALGPDALQLGKQCLEFLQTEREVIARFSGESVARGDVLIGADGLRSVVRAGLFGEQPPRYSGYIAWRGIVDYDTASVAPGESSGRGQRFGMLPLTDGRLYWFATANVPQNSRPSVDGEQAELLRRFSEWHDPIPDVLRKTEPRRILRSEIFDRDPIERWGDGRVTLLGDAAHPMTPNLGQGACQALEDAVELAKCLSTPDAANDLPSALRRYEAHRIPRTSKIVLAARRYGRLGQWESPAACWLRDRLMSALPHRMKVRGFTEFLSPDPS